MKRTGAILIAALLAGCANQPVAIYDKFNSGLNLEFAPSASPTPLKMEFDISEELYIVSPQKDAPQDDNAKSALIFLENGVSADGSYVLRHAVATGQAATELAAGNTPVVTGLAHFAKTGADPANQDLDAR